MERNHGHGAIFVLTACRIAMTRTLCLLVILVAFSTLPLPGQEAQKSANTTSSGDEMIGKFLCAESDRLSEKFLDGAATLARWQQKRPGLHREFLDMLGLWPVPDKSPLQAVITGTLEHEGVLIDKLHFQSRPKLYVTANLYRPKVPAHKKLPAILYVCGHANRGRDGNKSAYQDHGLWFASNGYICIVLDTLQLGEVPGIHHGTYGLRGTKPIETRWWWHSAGYTPAGVECWNGIRAIDYLVGRDDVDADKIGVTGISGGGATTFWIAAADERVKVAVPVSGMSDLHSYVNNKVINGHCDCMFLYNTHQWDWTTIAALVAPRPMLFANSDADPIFPMDGNRRVMHKLLKIYQLYGKPDLVEDHISKGDHAYRPDLRLAAFRFFNKHLKNDAVTPVKDADFKPVPGPRLRVFPTDADIPRDALNGRIDETFVPRAKVPLPEKGKFEEWKTALIQQLRKRSFSGFPDPVPAAILEKKPSAPADWARWVLTTEHDIQSQNLFVLQKGSPKTGTLILLDDKDIVPANGEISFPALSDWSAPLLPEKQMAMYIAPRGVVTRWSDPSPPNYVQRAHALLGRTVDQGRVWDLCAEIGWFAASAKTEKTRLNKFRVVGRGRAGIIAAYAALLEPSIHEIVIVDPPRSHKDGPHFLGILRTLDVPEALGLLAPRPLTLINAQDPAFDRTAEIYRIAGAADKLTRK